MSVSSISPAPVYPNPDTNAYNTSTQESDDTTTNDDVYYQSEMDAVQNLQQQDDDTLDRIKKLDADTWPLE